MPHACPPCSGNCQQGRQCPNRVTLHEAESVLTYPDEMGLAEFLMPLLSAKIAIIGRWHGQFTPLTR